MRPHYAHTASFRVVSTALGCPNPYRSLAMSCPLLLIQFESCALVRRCVWHILASEIAAFPVAALLRQLVAPLCCHQLIANLRLKDHEAACSDILLSLKGKAFFAVA